MSYGIAYKCKQLYFIIDTWPQDIYAKEKKTSTEWVSLPKYVSDHAESYSIFILFLGVNPDWSSERDHLNVKLTQKAWYFKLSNQKIS